MSDKDNDKKKSSPSGWILSDDNPSDEITEVCQQLFGKPDGPGVQMEKIHSVQRQLLAEASLQRRGIERQPGFRDQVADQLARIAAGGRRLIKEAGVGDRLGHVRQRRHDRRDWRPHGTL